ncbi:glycosyltransferase family 87 protein [Kitasatospora sp. NBC_01266]|uniref:glycosyltransferase family 87 protein n=1 Tax=Kitasatospora sp. NBC_01266 TaxID=2903572 RepID=UPI002E32EBE3|nr:glycosyltransferase 87 family protein [Kitasatospora sp. NBC_01266]
MTSSTRDETPATETAVAPVEGPLPNTVVVPADEDPIAAAGSELLGGPPGRRALLGVSWWIPARFLALATVLTYLVGMVQKLPCYTSGWFFGATAQYTHACYSDIPHLYTARGFAAGLHPYLDMLPSPSPDMKYLEYPVLTGGFMQIAGWLTPTAGVIEDRERWFWMVNAGMLLICAVITVIALTRTHRRRPWDALLFALAPCLALDATVNWDLLAVALTAVAMAYWSGRRTVWAGVFIGLATAAKLYPVLLLGPLLVLCWRSGRWREFWQATAGAVGAWLLVNVPIMIANFDGWATFYSFSQSRKEDFGSFWMILMQDRNESLAGLNNWIAALLIACCLGIGWLALTAPRRPRYAQLVFLVVAAFVVTNKVYSPQYVLWLIPLAALARPRWRDFLIWQACEVLYFLGIWSYLAFISDPKQHGIGQDWYHFAVVLHLAGTLYLCAKVIRDILRPEHDPVRWDGSDDPSGGVFDSAPDVFVIGAARRLREQESYAAFAPADGVDWLAEDQRDVADRWDVQDEPDAPDRQPLEDARPPAPTVAPAGDPGHS